MEERYNKLFTNLVQYKKGALVPFIMMGDPSLNISLKIVDVLVKSGADALELGMPFSDPLADGPIIQTAILRAFNKGTTIEQCFDMISLIRNQYQQLPIGLLTYSNLVFNKGIDNFYAKCAHVGIDSVLIADLPLEESYEFRNSATNHGILSIFICPPNADDSLLAKLVAYSKGYIYLLSRSGVTGIENSHSKKISQNLIDKLHNYKAPPLLQGFGISQPNQIKKIIASGVSGVIVGSALIKIIEQYHNKTNEMLLHIKNFIAQLNLATYM